MRCIFSVLIVGGLMSAPFAFAQGTPKSIRQAGPPKKTEETKPTPPKLIGPRKGLKRAQSQPSQEKTGVFDNGRGTVGAASLGLACRDAKGKVHMWLMGDATQPPRFLNCVEAVPQFKEGEQPKEKQQMTRLERAQMVVFDGYAEVYEDMKDLEKLRMELKREKQERGSREELEEGGKEGKGEPKKVELKQPNKKKKTI